MQKKEEPTGENDGDGGAVWDVDVFRQNADVALECSVSASRGPTLLRRSIKSVTSTSIRRSSKRQSVGSGLPRRPGPTPACNTAATSTNSYAPMALNIYFEFRSFPRKFAQPGAARSSDLGARHEAAAEIQDRSWVPQKAS
jgi:hypothetical protein